MASGELDGRVTLITGAGGGIGAPLARAAASRGATLILCGKRLEPMESVYDAIVADGSPEPVLFPLDLGSADIADYQRLVDGIGTDLGRLDGLVHLAARFDGLTPIEEHDVSAWAQILHVNLTAAFALTQACLPLLLQADDASVIFAEDRTSTAAYWGAYGVAKAGVDAFMRILAAETREPGRLRVNAVDPGPVHTALRRNAFPTGDPAAGPVDDVIDPFLYLLGPESRSVTGEVLTPGDVGASDPGN